MPPKDDETFWSAAGGWTGIVDIERLKEDLAAKRLARRCAVRLDTQDG